MAIVRVFESPCAADRLANAAAFLRSFAASKEILVVAASRTAADDLVRTVSAETGSAFGVERASWTQLAAMAAAIPLAEQGRTPLTTMGAEAIARYAAGAAAEGQGLEYLAPLTRFPGFAAALAATINELRLAEVAPVRLHEIAPELSDLAGLLRLFEKALHSMGLADRAALFDAAIEGFWTSTSGSRPRDASCGKFWSAPARHWRPCRVVTRRHGAFWTVPPTSVTSAGSRLDRKAACIVCGPICSPPRVPQRHSWTKR
jgi:hypothetical protein